MEIRKAEQSDSNEVSNILQENYNICSPEEGVKAFLEENKRGHRFLVAESSQKLIGLVSWLSHGLPKHMLAELDRIAVLDEFKGNGVARSLVDALISDAQNYYQSLGELYLRKLFLQTHADNTRAHRFYEKIGFNYEATLKEQYYEGKDEIIYSRFFNPKDDKKVNNS